MKPLVVVIAKKLMDFAEEYATDEMLDGYNASVQAEDTTRVLAYLTAFDQFIQVNRERA